MGRARFLIQRLTEEKLLGSAPNLDAIQDLIKKFYFGSSITLEPKTDGKEWTVKNSKGEIKGVKVKLDKGRYRFISESSNLVAGKLAGMRHAQYWDVHPFNLSKGIVMIRCETRVALVDINTGKAKLSHNGSTDYREIEKMRYTEVKVPTDMLTKIKNIINDKNKAA